CSANGCMAEGCGSSRNGCRARAERRGGGGAARNRPNRGAHERRSQKRTAPLLPRRPYPRGQVARGDPRDGEAEAIELVSSTAFAYLHPTGAHPESQQRLAVLHARSPFVACPPAPPAAVLRCHTAELVERVRPAGGWLDLDTTCT